MNESKRKNAEVTVLKKPSIYTEFILWTAMPHPEKVKLGLEFQQQFCDYYKIDKGTPGRWKQRPDFEPRVDAILKMWSTDRTPDVVHAIYRSAIKGNPMSQMLWLKYFKGFTEKQEVTVKNKVELTPGDIRFIIDGFPQEQRLKYYGYIREIIDTAYALRNAGQLEDGVATDLQLEAPVPGETNNNAQDVPRKKTNGVASSHTCSLFPDLEWKVSQNNHQSTERWWEK